MVQMVPVEFWSWVIPRIKEIHPEILFIAEIYEPGMYLNYLNTGGFDILYDKVQLYDTLRNIITGKGFTSHIPGVMNALKGINHRMLRFLENHDEQRIASRFFAGDPVKALPAMVLSSTLIFFGQEIGEPGDGITGFKGDDGRTTHFDYWGVQVHQQWMNGGQFDGGLLSPESKKVRKFYKTLLNLSLEKEVLRAGDFFDLYSWNMEILKAPGDQEVYYYLRYQDHDLFLIVLNFSEKEKKDLVISIPQQIRDRKIMIRKTWNPKTDLMGSGKMAYHEGKNKVRITMGAHTGLIFDLD
jgi:glycosidase